MPAAAGARAKNAVVIYSTRFGTTEQVAHALEHGLSGAGLQTACHSTEGFEVESLKEYDLICVGGPTEMFGAIPSTKDFLHSMEHLDLSGKYGFAFDTRLESRLSGSAAKYIEHSLDDQGLHLAAPRASAIVTNRKDGGKVVGADLKPGEEKRFVDLGLRLGKTAASETPA